MNSILKICVAVALTAVAPLVASSQVSYDNNNPFFTTPAGFLGWNQAGADLDIRTNNDTRMKILQSTGPLTINGQLVDLSGHVAIGQDVTSGYLPLSPVHIFGSAPPLNAGYRNWMQYGTAYSVDGFDMYVGPAKIGQGDLNSVISWTRSVTSSPGVPGVLRFISTDGDGSGDDQFAQDGLEVARMTDEGRMGVGTDFSDDLQPKRTLDVFHGQLPQLRLSQSLTTNINSGRKADFQVSGQGNLHLKPTAQPNLRTFVVGFLPGEEDNPQNLNGEVTVLDVAGLTRVRDLPQDEDITSILVGFANDGDHPEDNYLKRIDFPTGEDADCLVLNGQGEWIDV